MKKVFLLLFSGLLALTSTAQDKQYSIAEATLGLQTDLSPKTIRQLKWIPSLSAYSQISEGSLNQELLRTHVPKMSKETIISLAKLNADMPEEKPFDNFPIIHWINENQFFFSRDNLLYLGTADAGKWKVRKWHQLPQSAENISLEKTKLQVAFTKDNNLFLTTPDGEIKAVTTDDDKNILNGQSVHRNEFGIDGGVFFSPKGNYLAFYRMDQRMVDDYPVIDWSVTPAVNKNVKYPMAGRTSHEVTLGVYNPSTAETVYLKTGAPADQYLTCVSWSPDEKYIYVALLNRDQNHLKLNQYDVQTGDFLTMLFEEKDDKYIQPLHNLYFLPGKNNEFVWWSQRDGYMHLYRYNTDGVLLNKITSGEWVVNEILGANKAKKELIISASKESPMSKNVYAVNWEDGKIRRIDNDFGVHHASVSEDGKYCIDQFSNPEVPRRIEVVSTQSTWRKLLLNAADPLALYQRPEIKNVTIQADDGTALFGRLILPVNFNAAKKYPVIVYLYNGPNVQLLNNSFPGSGNLWYEYLAQRGYIVFTMDGRGSSNRGLKFEQAIFRQLGKVEMKDQLKGVDYLKSLPYVDDSRLGVFGWSYGGFMSTSLMLHYPGVFSCAVAGGPVIDWRMYEIMYTERYMDTPEQNPVGYEDANLLTKVGNLKGKLLMIHGALDDVVVWQHSVRFLKACIDNQVQVDYFIYPNHEHNVRGKDRVHLMEKITAYFDTYLKPAAGD